MMSNWATCPNMRPIMAPKRKSGCGSTSGQSRAMSRADQRLDVRVYDEIEAVEPPSLPVMTAAAVAVGQRAQASAASTVIFCADPASSMTAAPASRPHAAVCTASSSTCQRRGRSRVRSTLLNVKKSIRKMSTGMAVVPNSAAPGRSGARASMPCRMK